MIIIALHNTAKKIRTLLSDKTRWCYLGKDVTKREKVAKVLGEETRLYLKDRLHNLASKLSQPYLDFVAELGKEQKDQLNWWASKFASKNHFQMDFFLLLCYKAIVTEFLKQQNDKDRLVIFIEDPWLFLDIKNICDKRGFLCLGNPRLFLLKFYFLMRGISRRLLLIGWIIVAHKAAFYYHRIRRPEVLEKEKSAVGIINPAEIQTFKDGHYVNNYTPGLSDFYRKNRIPFFYIYPLYFPLSTAKYLGINGKFLWPLIFDVKFSKVTKRIFAYWRPVSNDDVLPNLDSYNISFLLQRERWFEFSRVGFNIHLILFDALDHFLSKKWCNSIIYIFENQPWEKMLCIAALKNNTKILGYQNCPIWKLFLAQFVGKGEESFVPLPYKLVTSGHHFARLYQEGGMPQDKIVVGGAWRYLYILNNEHSNVLLPKDIESKTIILISLSIDISITKSMLSSIAKEVSKKYINDEVELWIKPHPAHTKYELRSLNKLVSWHRIVNKPFVQLIKEADIVISSSSTTGLEAFFYGKKVISYIPENLLATDPLFDIEDRRIHRWFEGEDINIKFIRELGPDLHTQDITAMREKYFGKINPEVWLNYVS